MESTLSRDRLAADAVVIQAGRALQMGFGLASIVVLARALGPAEFGVFSTIVAVETAGFALADLGLGQLSVRAIAQRRADEASTIRKALPYLHGAASMVLAVSCILSLALVGGTFNTAAVCLLLGSSYVHVPARIAVERGFWLGALRFGRATMIDVTAAGLRAMAVAAVWMAGGKSLVAFAAGLAVAAVLTLLFVKAWFTYPFPEAPSAGPSTVKLVLKEAVPFALTSLTWNSFTELPKIVLAPTAGTTAVGQFAAGARFLTTAYLPLQSLLLVITPRLFAFAREPRGKMPATHPLANAAGVATLAGGGLAALLIAFAPLVPLLLGEAYRPAVSVLRILAVSLPFQALAFATGDWLSGVGRQQVRFVLTLVMVLLAVPALIMASKFAGPRGAAAAYTGLTALLGLSTAVASRRYLNP